MALQEHSIAVGAFDDADAGGKNYFAGVAVYIYKKSDDTLADIFTDDTGVTPITQDGVQNVSNANGVFKFAIDEGQYYSSVDGETQPFSILFKDHNALDNRNSAGAHDASSVDVLSSGKNAEDNITELNSARSFNKFTTSTGIQEISNGLVIDSLIGVYSASGGIFIKPFGLTGTLDGTSTITESRAILGLQGGGTVTFPTFIGRLPGGSIKTPLNAPTDHILIQSTEEGATRAHIEPNGVIENGTVTKLDWMLDPYDGGANVPYPDPDINYRIFNIFTKTGDDTGLNGENGAAVIGTKNRADGETWGLFTSMHFGFNDGAAVPMKMYYMDHSDTEWRTPMKNFWYEGKPLDANDYVLSGRRLYKCLTTGVCGATQPTHLTGTVSDGNLDFEFIRDYMDHVSDISPTVIFGTRDSMPKFGHQFNPVQYAAEPLFWAGVRNKHLSAGRQTGFGLVKTGVRTDAEAWQLEFYNNNRFRVYEDRYNTSGIVKQYNTSTLVDADIISGELQIPAGAEQVEVNLTTPTAISSISPVIGHQHITIIDLAGNLTLNDSAKIKTKDGLNLTMRAGTGRTFAVSLGGTLIREL